MLQTCIYISKRNFAIFDGSNFNTNVLNFLYIMLNYFYEKSYVLNEPRLDFVLNKSLKKFINIHTEYTYFMEVQVSLNNRTLNNVHRLYYTYIIICVLMMYMYIYTYILIIIELQIFMNFYISMNITKKKEKKKTERE